MTLTRTAVTCLLFAAAGCAATDSVAPTTKVASTKVETAASTAGMFRVPLILTGQNSAIVEMTLNGKPIVLLLDTGAQGTVMDLATATSLGVKSTASPMFNHGVGAGRVAIRQSEIITLNMSGFEAHVAPSLQDFSALMMSWNQRGGKKICGLLGYDVLHTYGAIIDLNEGAMYLRRPN
jgi:predicted aspartyl protease